MRKDYLIIGVMLFLALAYHRWTQEHERFSPFAVVQSVPVQHQLINAPAFAFQEYKIKPQAEFSVKALVLSARHYYFGRESRLVPVDLALGWGPMSDGNVLKALDISQGNRWYFYHYEHLPIPDAEIIAHSANMHLIPATPQIAAKIGKTKINDIIEFKGYLVNVTAEDGWFWNSSQSRIDTGQGSCELVWVDQFNIVEQ